MLGTQIFLGAPSQRVLAKSLGAFPSPNYTPAGMKEDAGWNQMLGVLASVMTTLLSEVTLNQGAMLSGNGFGRELGQVLGTPLVGFLGDLGGGLTRGGASTNSSGERIPGGTSLYKKGKGMFHKGAPGAPDTYAFENSPAGIAFAAKRGYASIDLDMQITKDGIPVATHWSKPLQKDGFYDPLGKINKDAKVSEMTFAEVSRLRNKDGQSRIYSMETMVSLLKQHGIAGDLEAKDDPRFATDEMMGYLANLVRGAGIKANLKSIDRGARSDKILKAAQNHGFWVRTAQAGKSKRQELGYGS